MILLQVQQRLSQVFGRLRVVRHGLPCLLKEIGGLCIVSPTKLHDPFRNIEIIGLIRHLCPRNVIEHEPDGANTQRAVPIGESCRCAWWLSSIQAMDERLQQPYAQAA